MTARRQLPTDEARDLLALTREIATKELAPRSAEAEATETFPRDVFRMLGQAGLLSLPSVSYTHLTLPTTERV